MFQHDMHKLRHKCLKDTKLKWTFLRFARFQNLWIFWVRFARRTYLSRDLCKTVMADMGADLSQNDAFFPSHGMVSTFFST